MNRYSIDIQTPHRLNHIYSLHRRAYQHKTSKIIEYMLTEALVLANDHIYLPGQNGPTKMSDAIFDMVCFIQLRYLLISLTMVFGGVTLGVFGEHESGKYNTRSAFYFRIRYLSSALVEPIC